MSREIRALGWGVVVAINLVALIGLFFALTEWVIAHKRSTTLIYAPRVRFHHELLPDQTYSRGALSYHIGPEGLRGSISKDMVVLGGSSVFDFRAEPSWPERIGATNGGIPGYSLREVVPFYEDRIRPLHPERALIYVGWNDLKIISASRETLRLPPYPKEDGPPPAQYDFLLAPRPLRNFYAVPVILEKLTLRAGFVQENTAPAVKPTKTSTAPIDWSTTPGMAYFRDRLNALLDELDRDGVQAAIVLEVTLATSDLPASERKRIALSFVKLTYDQLIDAYRALADAELDVCAKRKLPCIDLRTEMNGRPQLFTDHVHLSQAGSAQLAKLLDSRL